MTQEWWLKYADDRNLSAFIFVDSELFDIKDINGLTFKVNIDGKHFHPMLIKDFKPKIMAVRDGIYIPYNYVDYTFYAFKNFMESHSQSIFPVVNEENFDFIRHKDAIFILGDFGNGHNFYHEDFKDTLINTKILSPWLDRLNFAAVDYSRDWEFCENYIEDINSWEME